MRAKSTAGSTIGSHDKRGRPQLPVLPPPAAPNGFQPALQQDPKEKFLEQRRHDDGRYDGDGLLAGSAAAEQLFGRMGQFGLLIGRLLARPRAPSRPRRRHRQHGKQQTDEEEEQHVLRCQGTGRRRANGMIGSPAASGHRSVSKGSR